MQITHERKGTTTKCTRGENAKATARKLVSTSNVCAVAGAGWLAGWRGDAVLANTCLLRSPFAFMRRRMCVSVVQVNEVRMAQKPYRILCYLVIVIVTPLPSLPLSSSSSSFAVCRRQRRQRLQT